MKTQIRILTGVLDPSFAAATGPWLQGVAEEFSVGDDDAARMKLCLETLVADILDLAGDEERGTRIDVRATISTHRIILLLTDATRPYDPLTKHPPPGGGRGDVAPGEGGANPVMRLTQGRHYQRTDGKNHLELVFNLAQETKMVDRSRHVPRDVDRRNHFAEIKLPITTADGVVVTEDRRLTHDRRGHGVLSRSEVFHGVPFAILDQVIDRFPIQQFAAETVVLEPGKKNEFVHIVLGGCLKINVGKPGDEQFIYIKLGGCAGEMSIIDNQPVSAYVIAPVGTELLLIDGPSFIDDLLVMPKVARNLLSALAARMRYNNVLIAQRIRVEAEMKQMQRELVVAKEIQESLLPTEPLFSGDNRLECKGRMSPAKEVGGDFYDVFFLDQENLFFVIGDVCGKGLPAALFMVRAISALRAHSGKDNFDEDYVADIVTRLNSQLCEYNEKNQFLTAFCGILNLTNGVIHYINAGHNAPAIARNGSDFAFFNEPINPIVGMLEGLTYRSGTIELPPGGRLVLYTDGVTEAETHDTSIFGEDRLLGCLSAAKSQAADLVETIFASVEAFVAGAPQSDDITVLTIGRRAT